MDPNIDLIVYRLEDAYFSRKQCSLTVNSKLADHISGLLRLSTEAVQMQLMIKNSPVAKTVSRDAFDDPNLSVSASFIAHMNCKYPSFTSAS